jgi:hypothetical protein
MLVHLQDLEQLELSRSALDVDRPLGAIEPNLALPAPLPLQWLVMKTLVLAHFANPAFLDQRNPQPEFATDDVRNLV